MRQPSAMGTSDVWEMSDDEMPAMAFVVQDSRKRTILETFDFATGSRKSAYADYQTAMVRTLFGFRVADYSSY